ncbi:MAG TPA: hypothetical protein VIG47_07625 [Gemmatimonadaceae bacterium]
MSASALRAQYLSEAARILAPLPPSERADLLRELESHLADSVQSMAPDADEETRLHTAIARLGEPRSGEQRERGKRRRNENRGRRCKQAGVRHQHTEHPILERH